ncbi:hypothetical protein TWF718_007715 [Orbilia javanica]|uniref:BTB domain-containing protein n=1 Tax=Orbilia javanica TaxID=47235 RepID=A0AAN8RBT9_9PEZI
MERPAAKVRETKPPNCPNTPDSLVLYTPEHMEHSHRLPKDWANIPKGTPTHSEPDTDTSRSESPVSKRLIPRSITVNCVDSSTNTQRKYKLDDIVEGDKTESILVEDWDCIILTGARHRSWKHLYGVSKDVLCASSPVFGNMKDALVKCYIPLSTDTGTIEYKSCYLISLVINDSWKDLELIFRIMHFTTFSHDLDIDFGTLRRVARICSAFSWQTALRSWSHLWLQKYEHKALLPEYEGWLEISNIFGTAKEVEKLVELLANECSEVQQDKVTRYASGRHYTVSTEHWPANLRDTEGPMGGLAHQKSV